MRFSVGHRSDRPARRRAAKGFTLIELLTVVAIIGLLVTMVVPTIRSVIQAQQAVVTRTRIRSLDAGVRMYKMQETGNKYFPGQQPWAVQAITQEQNASAFLARALFTDWQSPEDDPEDKPFPVGAYAKYEQDMLDDESGKHTERPYTILDGYATPMAVLYFPARLDEDLRGEGAQFVPNDNAAYLDEDNIPPDTTVGEGLTGVVDEGDTIRNDGEFLLIAPGRGRLYFDSDDIANW